MSIAAMAWAFKCPIDDPTCKFVLIAVANYSDETNKAWPSLGRLAKDTAFDRSTISRALKKLDELGYISRESRLRDDGSRSSDMIFLAIGAVQRGSCAKQHPPLTAPLGVGAECDGGSGTAPPLEPSLNLQPKPPLKSKKVALRAPDDWPSDFGEKFWKKYPAGRKTGRLAVIGKLAAVRRRGNVLWATIDAGLDRYIASNPDPEFTKGPLVWVNQGCWDDEITIKNGGFNGHRGSRTLQDDSLSVTTALRKLGTQVEQGNLTFAPRPSLLPAASGTNRRLLPKG